MRMRLPLAALVLLVLAPLPAARASSVYWDVPDDQPALTYVDQLQAMGVMVGMPDESFRGNSPVTRYELAVVVGRMVSYVEQSLPKGMVFQPISKEARDEISRLTYTEATALLHKRSVRMPRSVVENPGEPATVDEVADLIASAVSALVERISPGAEEE